MSRVLAMTAIAGLALTQAATAQFSITPGGANAGNGNFAQGASSATMAGTGQAGANMRRTTTASQDQAFQDAWFFRVGADTRELAFASGSSGGYTSTSALVGNNANTLDTGGYNYTITNSTAGTSFTAELRWTILTNGVDPFVAYSARITNNGNADLPISLFHYNDFDVNATTASDVFSYASGVFTISEGALTLFHTADGADAYQGAVFAANRLGLNDALVTNLPSTVTGSPGDYTSAFQWNRVVAPGGSVTVGGYLGFVVPTPGAAALFGVAGLGAIRRRR